MMPRHGCTARSIRADGRLKFAVVREEPRVELALMRQLGARHVLLIASGGCPALALHAAAPTCS